MKLFPLACLLCAFASPAWAHRLDEYLQATRVAVATNRIDLSIELTPGVAIADQLLMVIDRNRDGQVSEDECTDYVQRFLKDIQLKLDEKVLGLRVKDVSFPPLFEIRSGVGVIRLKATAPIEQLPTGSHSLSLTNSHLPAISVYLVNAIAPKVPTINITKQSRDELQKNYRLEFGVVLARQEPPP